MNKYIYHITYTENLKEIKVNYKNNYVYLLSERCFYSDIFKRIGFINNNIKMSKNDFIESNFGCIMPDFYKYNNLVSGFDGFMSYYQDDTKQIYCYQQTNFTNRHIDKIIDVRDKINKLVVYYDIKKITNVKKPNKNNYDSSCILL